MIADDHLVFGWGNTMEEAWKVHDNNLNRFLERAKKIRLWFNSAKMRLRHEEVRYLGLYSTLLSEQEAEFKNIKQLVTAAPVLQFYDINKEVTIQCDAGSFSWEQYWCKTDIQ